MLWILPYTIKDVIKNPKRRHPGLLRVSPKCNHIYLCKWGGRESFETEEEAECGNVTIKQEMPGVTRS
jgi:hypothetical protein